MEHWDEGVYAFRGKGAAQAIPLIISAGVHGDETAPVKVLEHLNQQLQARALIPHRPCLLIIANMPALLNGKRFMQVNMNRLFGAPVRPPCNESKRALALEQYCQDFAELYGVGWHLDLHATIKPSRHAHFALMPASERHYDDTWVPLLASHGITALVRQTTVSHTFSAFTCNRLGYESFTLECGAIGSDETAVTSLLETLLCHLLQDDPFAETGSQSLQRYEVCIDLIKRSEQFEFLVDERSENFTEFAAGTAIASADGIIIHAPVERTALLFANSQVPVKDRAGLLLKPL